MRAQRDVCGVPAAGLRATPAEGGRPWREAYAQLNDPLQTIDMVIHRFLKQRRDTPNMSG